MTMIKGVDHIAVAVENIDASLENFEKLFGATVEHREEIAGYNVEVATVRLGNTCIEFVEGKTTDSPTRNYVEKKGQGIHHIAFEVENIEAAIAGIVANGGEMIDEEPRIGKDNSRVAFVHPKSSGRILYELVENRK